MPDGWAWCRLSNACSILMGQSPEGTSVSNNTNGMEFHQGKIFFTNKYLAESGSYTAEITRIAPESSLLLCVRAPVGVVNITKREICIGRGLCAIKPNYIIDENFWFYWIQCLKADFEQKATGTTFKTISVDIIKQQLIPLPPLLEQQLIINTIERIFSHIENLEKEKNDLQNIIKQTKSKILDLAIHGKLVSQDPNDEPAEELLKRIATSDNRPYKKFEEDEVPFIIPFNWKWERLAKISSIISKGTTPRGGKNAYCIEGINYLRVENISADGTINLEDINHISENEHLTFLKRSILQENDVIISIAGTLGKIGIIRKCDLPMNTNQAIAFVRISNLSIINLKYLRYVLESVELQRLLLSQTKVTSIPNLTLEIINNCPIPLPPIQEQNRIVSKIEELFSDLDSISSNLE